ncbi:MAG TPA: hypothetical protein VF463_10515 [Sphingobium sp.]
MADQNIVTLSIGGQLYAGWKDVTITRALDTLSGEFSLDLTDRERQGAARLALAAGGAVALKIDGETLITGYIDRVGPGLDPDSHPLSASGRDKSADLIDCAPDARPGSWSNTSIEAIVGELAKPFGIGVTAKASTAPKVRKFAIQQGETVSQSIERLMRMRGLLAVSTRAGDIEIITPANGAPVARLVEGENLLSLSATHDVSDRFSSYIVKGQAAGDDDVNGKAASAIVGRASDPGVKRHRPLVLIAEEQGDLATLEKRAKWEATTRAARGQEATATVLGWRRPDGKLWDRDAIVELEAPSLYISSRMLIVSVTLQRSGGGSTAELRLMPPEAFTQLAVPEQAESSSVKRK